MSSLNETAYPRFKLHLSEKDLNDVYTPSQKERFFARKKTQNNLNCLAFLVHLKVFQKMGFFLKIKKIPQKIINHIMTSLKIKAIDQKKLLAYDDLSLRNKHQSLIRNYLKVSPYDSDAETIIFNAALSAAQTNEVISDIINAMLEQIVKDRYELPAFSTFDRIAYKARTQVNTQYYQQTQRMLTPEIRQLIDKLFVIPVGENYSLWHQFKQEPKKPTPKKIRKFLQHHREVKEYYEKLPDLHSILPQAKYRQFYLEAIPLDAKEMARMKSEKRYTLAIIQIRSKFSKTLDDIAESLIKVLQKMDNNAQLKLEEYHKTHLKRTDNLVQNLHELLIAINQVGSDTERLQAIEDVLPKDVDKLIDDCEAHMNYSNNNYLPFLVKPYQNKRNLLFECIDLLDLKSSTSDRTTETMIKLINSYRSSRKTTINLIEAAQLIGVKSIKLSWLPEAWRKLVTGMNNKKTKVDRINRIYFELSVFEQIKKELRNGDLYIEQAEEYDDPQKDYISDEEYDAEIEDCLAQLNFPSDPHEFVTQLKKQVISRADQVDADFPENESVSFKNGKISIQRIKGTPRSNELKAIDKLINERLPKVNIIDVLIEIEKSLNLHKIFRPLSGFDPKINNRIKRFISTLFCFGCNLGATQTADAIKNFTRKQISWLNFNHVNESKLTLAIEKVINRYNRFDLPKYWGSGDHASADGTIWNLYEENLVSEMSLRYGRYGGIGYYHVSDKYIALFSHFIPCGAWEAIYILDGITNNNSDIKPSILHGDTQAQNFPVFALSYLLGIELMPRIRNLHDLTFYRPEKGKKYSNINSLFGEPIKWDLIELHFKDIFRVVLSIKKGKMSPSTLLKRLCVNSKKNRLYFAFRELGRAIRTLFLLKYIGDIDVRKTIQTSTNKSEQFNGFVKWLFFGNDGIIAENIRRQQGKIIKFNHLVANMVVLYNVNKMTEILIKLQNEGKVKITPDILAHLNPYRKNLNRFGSYSLDIKRKTSPLDHKNKII